METLIRDSLADLKGFSAHSLVSDGHFFEEVDSDDKIKNYLESTKEIEKLKGMKWLLAMISKGRNVSEFFPNVVKNVSVKSVEVKKMVYIYLVHYADFDKSCREIALLSINSFQKDLAGANALIRGLALRVMTSIRVTDIIQIQLLAVKKCSTDSSPYVRRCAAVACTKIFSFDTEQLNSILDILSKLLTDTSTMVLGSAIAAFNEICPTRYDVIHKHYRRICHLVADLEEWSQVPTLQLLTRYARNQFTSPIAQDTENPNGLSSEDAFVPRNTEHGSVFQGREADIEGDLDPDHRLLLRSVLPLLKSRNSAVVLNVASLCFYCGGRGSALLQVAKSLVRILRNRREMQYMVLTAIHGMACECPQMFQSYLSDFYIKAADASFNKTLKLKILTQLATVNNLESLLREYATYIKESNCDVQVAVVRSLASINTSLPRYIDSSMNGVYNLLVGSKHSGVIRECVLGLRLMIQHAMRGDNNVAINIMRKLFRLLVIDTGIDDAEARAAIVWLAGEYQIYFTDLVPDILRVLAITFPEEAVVTRMQILNFAVKLSLLRNDETKEEDQKIQDVMTYILEMARYDIDTDLRDRSRYFTALLGLAPSNESAIIDEDSLEELANHAQAVLCANKPPSHDHEHNTFTLGSLSSVMQHCVSGYSPLCDWPQTQPDPSVRDSVGDTEYRQKNDHVTPASAHFSDSDESKSESDSSASSDSESESSSDSDDSESDSDVAPRKQEPVTRVSAISRPHGERQALRRVKGQGRGGNQPVVNILNIDDNTAPSSSTNDMMLLDMMPLAPAASSQLDSHGYTDIQTGNTGQMPYMSVSTPPLEAVASITKSNESSSDAIMAQIMESFNINPTTGRSANEVERPSPPSLMSHSPSHSASTGSAPTNEILSIAKVILSGELSSGLCVALRFRHQARAVSLPGGNCVTLSVKNTSDYSLRRVRFVFPSDIRRTPVDDILVVAPGGEINVPMELLLMPHIGRTIAIQCTCDRGSFSGSVSIDACDLLSPYPLSAREFEQLRAALGGFNATHTVVSPSKRFDQNTVKCMLERFNIYHVEDSVVQMCFAGHLRKEMMEHRLLIAISEENKDNIKISVHSDDPVLCTTLTEVLKKYATM